MVLNEAAPEQIDDLDEEQGDLDEQRLNLTISNRKEYFDLLFDLLNLGLDRVTSAVWNLLEQIPINKHLDQ
jgi:hypothetical protein